MTFTALQTIHSILENEKYKAEKVLEAARYNYNEDFDQKADELGSNARAARAMTGRAVTTKYENAKHDLDKVTQALQEFESHDWR